MFDFGLIVSAVVLMTLGKVQVSFFFFGSKERLLSCSASKPLAVMKVAFICYFQQVKFYNHKKVSNSITVIFFPPFIIRFTVWGVSAHR